MTYIVVTVLTMSSDQAIKVKHNLRVFSILEKYKILIRTNIKLSWFQLMNVPIIYSDLNLLLVYFNVNIFHSDTTLVRKIGTDVN